MNKDEIKKRIMETVDFIKSPKHDNSLAKFLAKNGNELENSAIARLLMMTEKEVEEIYQKAVDILKKKLLKSKNGD